MRLYLDILVYLAISDSRAAPCLAMSDVKKVWDHDRNECVRVKGIKFTAWINECQRKDLNEVEEYMVGSCRDLQAADLAARRSFRQQRLDQRSNDMRSHPTF